MTSCDSIAVSSKVQRKAKGKKSAREMYDLYAEAEFPAHKLDHSLDEIKAKYREAWPSIAIAIALYTKDHEQCREIAQGLLSAETDDGSILLEKMLANLKFDVQLLRYLLELAEMGEMRLLAAGSRLLHG